MIDLDPGEARRIALWRQGLLGAQASPAAATRAGSHTQQGLVRGLLDDLGAVQLDTISVLARSHELVAYARLGAVRRSAIEAAYWSGDATFEYWSHAACILPMASWPLFAFRRRHFVRKGQRWHGVPQQAVREILARIASEGPLTTSDVGGAKRGGAWWDWSESKIALEWLLDIGEVVCTRRVGWRRVYDLAERVVPAELREGPAWSDDDGVHGPSDDDCLRELVRQGARTVGVGTSADIADVHRLPVATVERHATDVGLVRARVPGWPRSTRVTDEALGWLAEASRARHRTTLLSPFDSLVWHRQRVERLFGLVHRLEAYTPAAKRVHGYFAMPVLHGGRLVARVDPRRSGETLVAERVTFEKGPHGAVPAAAVDGTARALREAAGWVGCSQVRVRTVVPGALAEPLQRALAG